MKSLRLLDFSDRELLHLVMDHADHEGWADSKHIAEYINLDHPRPHACVAGRLAYLWRHDVLEREHMRDAHGMLRYISGDPGRPKYAQRWRLTPIGRALATGRLGKTEQAALNRLKPEQMLMVTRWLAGRYQTTSDEAAILMRREWVYGMAQRLNGKS